MSHNDEYIGYDPHDVDHGTMYYKMHWGAYKGHVRGIIRGLVVGCAIGAGIGLVMSGLLGIPALLGAMHLAASSVPTVGTLMAGFSVFGGAMASGLMGRLGNAAGNVASQLAELELRERYPELPEVSPNSPEPGFGHHYEVPADRDKGKIFHTRVGLTGALMGGGFGALMGKGLLGAMHIPADIALTGGMFSAPVVLGSIIGGSFGISRNIFKSILNFTDNLLHGKMSGPTPDQLAKSRERYRLMGEDGPPSVITSLQRQEEFYRLQNGYFKKAFEAGFAGNARGLVGGLVSGGLIGSLLAGAAILALGATGGAAGVLFAAIVAFTMHKAMDFFTEASFEASGHGHVHEIHHERMRAMRKGIDLGFEQAEHNIVKRRQADPELTPPDAQEKRWVNPRVAVVMATVGALVGAGLAPLATGVAKLVGISMAGAHAAVPTALGMTTFGVVGSVFGLGPKVTEALHSFGDRIFHGTFFPGDKHPEIKTQGRIPLMSPRSELAEHFSEHLGQVHAQAHGHHHQPDMEIPQREANQRPMQNILERGARSLTQQVQEAPAAEMRGRG